MIEIRERNEKEMDPKIEWDSNSKESAGLEKREVNEGCREPSVALFLVLIPFTGQISVAGYHPGRLEQNAGASCERKGGRS